MDEDPDVPEGMEVYDAHVEMELMSQAGFSTADVLRIATLNGARFLGIEDKAGDVSPGKIANLLILEWF